MGIGMGLCAAAPIYGILFLALMIAGIGEGFIEGLATPFVQDLHNDQPGRYINFTHSFWSVGVLATVLISGVLLSLGVSWRLIIGAVSLSALIPASILLLPSRNESKYPEHPEPLNWKTVHNHSIAIIKVPRFWLFFAAMFVAGGGEFCLTFWCASYIQLNFSAAAWAGGVGTAFFAAGMVLGRTGWGYLLHQHHLRQLIVYSALAGTVITLFFPVLTNLWLFFALLFLSGIATAPFGRAYKAIVPIVCGRLIRQCCLFYYPAPASPAAASSPGSWALSEITAAASQPHFISSPPVISYWPQS